MASLSHRVKKKKKKPNQVRNHCHSESRLVAAYGWGGERWGVTANRFKVSFGGEENVLKLDYNDGYTAL